MPVRPNETNFPMSFLNLDFDFCFVFINPWRSICIKSHDSDHGAGLVPWGDNDMCFVKTVCLHSICLFYSPSLQAALQFAVDAF